MGPALRPSVSLPRLHAIFARVVFAEDFADLPGKVLVGLHLGLVRTNALAR